MYVCRRRPTPRLPRAAPSIDRSINPSDRRVNSDRRLGSNCTAPQRALGRPKAHPQPPSPNPINDPAHAPTAAAVAREVAEQVGALRAELARFWAEHGAGFAQMWRGAWRWVYVAAGVPDRMGPTPPAGLRVSALTHHDAPNQKPQP